MPPPKYAKQNRNTHGTSYFIARNLLFKLKV